MALILIPLAIIAIGLVSYGMSGLHREASAGFLGWLAHELRPLWELTKRGPITGPIVRLVEWVAHHVGSVFLTMQKPLTGWIKGMDLVAGAVQQTAYSQAERALTFGYWLVFHEIPQAIGIATRPLSKAQRAAVARANAQAHTITANAHAVPQTAHRVAMDTVPSIAQPYVDEWSWIHRHWKALTTAVAGAGVLGLPGELGLQDTIDAIKKRLAHIGKYGLTGVAAGVVGVALSRLGLGRARCNNTDKSLKRLCGLDPNLLESILADTLAIFGTISIVELAKGMQVLTPAVRYGVGGLIRETPSEFENVPRDVLDAALALIPGF